MLEHANVLAALEVDADAQAKVLSLSIAFEDRKYSDAENDKYFLRHSVVFGDGEPMALGGGCRRYPGLNYLSLHYRTGHGLQSLYEMAGQLIDRYTDLTLPGNPTIVFRVASTIKLPQDAKGFSQLQVVCPFYFDIRS